MQILLWRQMIRMKELLHKYTKDFKAMEKSCEKALKQIKDRRYQEYLLNDDRQNIMYYGITFCRKRCKVLVER